MNEQLVHVDIFVDATKPEQISALSEFLAKLGSTMKELDNSDAPEKIETPKANKKVTKKEAEAKSAPEAGSKAKTEPGAEPQIPGVGDAAEETPKKTYQIEEVREKLKEKVSEHREEIKAKLTELGAPNVSNLDPEKYSEFVDFLSQLS